MTRRTFAKKSKKPKWPCALCGSSKKIELHHGGGRNHVPWFTIPLCREHHVKVTALIYQAGIDMRYVSSEEERLSIARQAIYVFLWILEERQKNLSKKVGRNEPRHVPKSTHRRTNKVGARIVQARAGEVA